MVGLIGSAVYAANKIKTYINSNHQDDSNIKVECLGQTEEQEALNS